MKTYKQLLKEASAIEHNDLSGDYDDISINLALLVLQKWIDERVCDFKVNRSPTEIINELIGELIKERSEIINEYF